MGTVEDSGDWWVEGLPSVLLMEQAWPLAKSPEITGKDGARISILPPAGRELRGD